jgi:hypothetical protein
MLPVGLSPPEAVELNVYDSDSIFLGQICARDEACNMGPGKPMLVAATRGLPSSIETGYDLAGKVDDLGFTVCPQSTVGVVPDHHD